MRKPKKSKGWTKARNLGDEGYYSRIVGMARLSVYPGGTGYGWCARDVNCTVIRMGFRQTVPAAKQAAMRAAKRYNK